MENEPESLIADRLFLWAVSGLLPPGTQFDLFRGTAAMKQDVEDMYPTTLMHTIKVEMCLRPGILLMLCLHYVSLDTPYKKIKQ